MLSQAEPITCSSVNLDCRLTTCMSGPVPHCACLSALHKSIVLQPALAAGPVSLDCSARSPPARQCRSVLSQAEPITCSSASLDCSARSPPACQGQSALTAVHAHHLHVRACPSVCLPLSLSFVVHDQPALAAGPASLDCRARSPLAPHGLLQCQCLCLLQCQRLSLSLSLPYDRCSIGRHTCASG